METRASKRRTNAATLVENQQLRKLWVVLGELPNLPNLIASATLNQHKLQCRKNPIPKVKKSAATKKSFSLVDFKLDKAVEHDLDAKSGTYLRTMEDPHITEPLVSDIYNYLHTMENQIGDSQGRNACFHSTLLVLFTGNSYVKVVILNRPRKLNVLNHEMICQIKKNLTLYENDSSVKLVILKVKHQRKISCNLLLD